MLTDLVRPVCHGHGCGHEPYTQVAAISGNHGLLASPPSTMLVVAGDDRALVPTLRPDRRTPLVGDPRIGRASRPAGIGQATWADDDLGGGRSERKLLTLADGVPSARKFRWIAR